MSFNFIYNENGCRVVIDVYSGIVDKLDQLIEFFCREREAVTGLEARMACDEKLRELELEKSRYQTQIAELRGYLSSTGQVSSPPAL